MTPEHESFVDLIEDWIKKEFNNSIFWCLKRDNKEVPGSLERRSNINIGPRPMGKTGKKPDITCEPPGKGIFLLGEAKSSNRGGIISEYRSIKQLDIFFEDLALMAKRAHINNYDMKFYFIVALPCAQEPFASEYFDNQLKEKKNKLLSKKLKWQLLTENHKLYKYPHE